MLDLAGKRQQSWAGQPGGSGKTRLVMGLAPETLTRRMPSLTRGSKVTAQMFVKMISQENAGGRRQLGSPSLLLENWLCEGICEEELGVQSLYQCELPNVSFFNFREL